MDFADLCDRGLRSKIIVMTDAERQIEIKKLQAIIDKKIAFTHIIKLFTK